MATAQNGSAPQRLLEERRRIGTERFSVGVDHHDFLPWSCGSAVDGLVFDRSKGNRLRMHELCQPYTFAIVNLIVKV